MSLAIFQNQVCPACHESFSPHVIGKVRECEYETTQDSFPVHLCDRCDAVFLNPRPSDETLPIIYPSDYYSYEPAPENSGAKKSFLARIFAQIRRRNLEKNILALAPKPQGRPLRVLDIGCGSGVELDQFREVYPDAETWGVELGEHAAANARKKGHRTLVGKFEDVEPPKDYFDVVISLHVIEHVADPRAFLAKGLSLLAKDGIFVIATPNTDCYDFKVLKTRHWGGYHAPRHWCLFNRRTFEALSKSMGFQLVKCTSYTLSSFWVVSCHSIASDLVGKRMASALFPPVKIMKGGLYSFFLLSFFAAFERFLVLVTGKGNAMWVTVKR